MITFVIERTWDYPHSLSNLTNLTNNSGARKVPELFFVSLASPKILPLGHAQIDLALRSLIRIFADAKRIKKQIRYYGKGTERSDQI